MSMCRVNGLVTDVAPLGDLSLLLHFNRIKYHFLKQTVENNSKETYFIINGK